MTKTDKFHKRCAMGGVVVCFGVMLVDRTWIPHWIAMILVIIAALWMLYWGVRRDFMRPIEYKTCPTCGGSGEVENGKRTEAS